MMNLHNQLQVITFKIIRVLSILSLLYCNVTLSKILYGPELHIINATPTLFKLELQPRNMIWQSKGGIGTIKRDTQQVIPLQNERSDTIYLEPWSKGSIKGGSDIKFQVPLQDIDTSKLAKILAITEIHAKYYAAANGQRTIKTMNLTRGKPSNKPLYRAIRPEVDKKTGNWKKDKYGNNIYFFEHFENKESEFNKYWEHEKPEILRERKVREWSIEEYK